MRKTLLAVALLILLTFLTGCQDTGALTVVTDVDGASVYIGNEFFGITPLTITQVDVGFHRLFLEKEGYLGSFPVVEILKDREVIVKEELFPKIYTVVNLAIPLDEPHHPAQLLVTELLGYLQVEVPHSHLWAKDMFIESHDDLRLLSIYDLLLPAIASRESMISNPDDEEYVKYAVSSILRSSGFRSRNLSDEVALVGWTITELSMEYDTMYSWVVVFEENGWRLLRPLKLDNPNHFSTIRLHEIEEGNEEWFRVGQVLTELDYSQEAEVDKAWDSLQSLLFDAENLRYIFSILSLES